MEINVRTHGLFSSAKRKGGWIWTVIKIVSENIYVEVWAIFFHLMLNYETVKL